MTSYNGWLYGGLRHGPIPKGVEMKSRMRVAAFVLRWFGVLLVLGLGILAASAQEAKPADGKVNDAKSVPDVVETLFLNNAYDINELNETQTDLRNMLPKAKIYGIASRGAISIRGAADDIKTAKAILADLDKPKRTYRLTYTLSEFEAGKRSGSQRYSFIAFANQKAEFKQGMRVPISTGNTEGGGSQVQYVDIGLNIQATFDGRQLRTKVEESSLADEKPGVDPTIRQIVLEEVAVLAPGKPVSLGSFDHPGSAHTREIEVTAEALP